MSGVVAVVAHPDDESLIAGGTLALAARAGLPTGVLSLTRGELGPIVDPELGDRAHLGEIRTRELQDAARALGIDWADCLRLPDGELPWADVDFAADVVAERLRTQRPEVVLTFGEDGLYGHPDHVATAQIARRAAQRVNGSAQVYEAVWPSGTMAALVGEARERGLATDLWGLEPEDFGSDQPVTVAIDIRSVLPQKLEALRAHRTQLDKTHLFLGLTPDLAERHLGTEAWAGPDEGRLEEMLKLV